MLIDSALKPVNRECAKGKKSAEKKKRLCLILNLRYGLRQRRFFIALSKLLAMN
jgi:hypothetical protein